MPRPLASHSSSKVLEKSGKASKGASVNLVLSSLKADSYACPHTKGTFFLVSSFKEQAIVLKSLTKRR